MRIMRQKLFLKKCAFVQLLHMPCPSGYTRRDGKFTSSRLAYSLVFLQLRKRQRMTSTIVAGTIFTAMQHKKQER